MKEYGEREEPPAGNGEGEEEPFSQPFYDPLISPWDERPMPSQFQEGEPDGLPPYRFDYQPPEPPEPEPRQPPFEDLGPVIPPYQEPDIASSGTRFDAEALNILRQRLRADAVILPKPEKRRWSVTVREVAETLILALLIFLAVRMSLQNFRVEGQSMLPGLDDGEYLIVNKLAYAEIDTSLFDWLPFYDAGDDPVHHLWGAPRRGDVIVFRAPTNVNRDFIKRIIGVPGDAVSIDTNTGKVVVNGQALEEAYLQTPTVCSQQCGPWTVPADSYFVLGDNRQNSSDSRQGWFVPEENIIGKALITYWNNDQPEFELAPNHRVPLAPTGVGAAGP